jgi:hypothetical protein
MHVRTKRDNPWRRVLRRFYSFHNHTYVVRRRLKIDQDQIERLRAMQLDRGR